MLQPNDDGLAQQAVQLLAAAGTATCSRLWAGQGLFPLGHLVIPTGAGNAEDFPTGLRHLEELSAPASARIQVPSAHLARGAARGAGRGLRGYGERLGVVGDKLEVPGGQSAARRYGALVACILSRQRPFCES